MYSDSIFLSFKKQDKDNSSNYNSQDINRRISKLILLSNTLHTIKTNIIFTIILLIFKLKIKYTLHYGN